MRPSKRNFTESYSEIVQGLQNKTLIVTTILVSYDIVTRAERGTRLLSSAIRPPFQSQPYSMYKVSQDGMTGNDRFEGYAIDLIKEIAEILS